MDFLEQKGGYIENKIEACRFSGPLPLQAGKRF